MKLAKLFAKLLYSLLEIDTKEERRKARRLTQWRINSRSASPRLSVRATLFTAKAIEPVRYLALDIPFMKLLFYSVSTWSMYFMFIEFLCVI